MNNITRARNTILFVGYQAIGTLGRQIVDGAKRVRIMGKRYPIKAKIVQLNGFSAHADRDELLEWLSGFTKPPRRLFVTHGESDASASFAELVKQQKGWNITIPEYRQVEFLD